MTRSAFWNSTPANHRYVLAQHEREHAAAIMSRSYLPYVYPQNSFGPLLLILYLLLPHTKSKIFNYARYPVFATIVYLSLFSIFQCRSANTSVGFGIGLLNGWAILWSATLIIFHDAHTAFKRVERLGKRASSEQKAFGKGTTRYANGSMASDGQGSRARRASKITSSGESQHWSSATDIDHNMAHNDVFANRFGPFAWQPLPAVLAPRVDWTLDLVSNFRGVGWNYQISSLPPLPAFVQRDLNQSPGPSSSTSKTGYHRYDTVRSLLRAKIFSFIVAYLAIDVMKLTMMRDPYFWSLTTVPPPAYLPNFITSSSAITRIYRLLLSLAMIHTTLYAIFLLGPLFFVGVLGPGVIGARGEPWMYPDTSGSYRTVFSKGLAGWWGGWWHQTFRSAFEAPTVWLCDKLGWEKRSQKGKLLGLFIAFACSACLHASGSLTIWGETRPLREPATFFLLQPFGIVAQMMLAGWLKHIGVRDRLPKWVRGLANFTWTHIWFYYTAPFLCDDFAKGGIWSFEPIPISILRGLGFGLEGQGWWCWTWPWFTWYSADRWWMSGLAI